MRKIKYDILNYLAQEKSIEMMSDVLEVSKKQLDKLINELIADGYLNADLTLTEKKHEKVSSKNPRNAIILASDLGIGMLTVGKNVPIGLLELEGEVVIERLIRQLYEVGIYKIDIVVGFLAEKYEYLIDKYNVNLVYNEEYASKASLYSLYLVQEKIANTYIFPGNIWAEKNPFSKEELYSWYGISDTVDNNSIVRLKPKTGLVKVEKNKGGNSMIGLAYILEEDARILRKQMDQLLKSKRKDKKIWEEALFDQEEKMIVYSRVFSSNQMFSIKDYEQLRYLEESSSELDTEIIDLITQELNVNARDIYDIFVLESGKTNRSFRFTAKGKQYIMRIPGEGTDELVNRENEYLVYQLLKGRKISDQVVYISPDTGYKISEFIEGTRSCDPHNKNDVLVCMQKLRKFHDYKLEVDHVFDPFSEIEHYEQLRGDAPSKYADYAETKKNIESLKPIVDALPKEWVLSHCDSVPGNFLLTEDEVYLIDWEYAGMQDPHIDLAMFSLSAMYSREEVDALLDTYFVEGYDEQTKYKIYCYIAIGGLLWSNWSEYKELFGVEFGKYSLKQYEFAQKYYEIVKSEFIPSLAL